MRNGYRRVPIFGIGKRNETKKEQLFKTAL